MSLQENKKLVEIMRTTWKDSNNPKATIELFHPDCEWLLVASGQTFRGRDEVGRMIEQSMAPRDAQFEVPNAFAGEDQVFLEWINQGTITGPIPNFFDAKGTVMVVPPGTKYSFPVCAVAEVKDSKLYRVREYYDTETLLRQLRSAATGEGAQPR